MRHRLLIAVLALALGIRLWALRSLGFDGLYGQDAYAYYYHGLALWRDHALSYHWPWLPAPTRLFWPLGEPALVATAFALVGHASATAALAVSMLAGLGAVALVYALGARVAGTVFPTPIARWTGALAGALIALSGLQVQASGTVMSDAPALFWGLAALWLWTMPRRSSGDRRFIADTSRWSPRGEQGLLTGFAAGACYALAVSTRFEYAPLAVAMGVYWLAHRGLPWGVWTRHRWSRAATAQSKPGHHAFPSAPAALAGAALAGLPQLLYSLSYRAPVVQHQWLTTWGIAHLWQARFATVDGVQHYPMSVGAFYLLRPLFVLESLPFTLAPCLPLGIWGLAGGLRLAAKARRAHTVPGAEAETRGLELRRDHTTCPDTERDADGDDDRRGLLGLLLAWWLVPALYLAGVPFESARFALIYMPPLAILEAVGLVVAVQEAGCRRVAGAAHRPAPLLRSAAGMLWAVLSLGILAADARGPLAALARGKVTDQQAVHWLDGNAPRGAPIATFGLTLTLYHYGDLVAHHWTLLDLSAATHADLRRAAANERLVVVANVGNLASQWRGLPPEQALLWLRAHARLRSVATIGGYTVFTR